MNILIVKLSAIGDVIHALPVSYALRRKFPDAHITWVVEPTAYEIVKHNPCVDEVILFQKKAFKTMKGFRENFKPLYKQLHQRRYDISIDLQGLFKSLAVVLTANAKRKIGYIDMREGSNLISKPIKGSHHSGHLCHGQRPVCAESCPPRRPLGVGPGGRRRRHRTFLRVPVRKELS